MDPLSHLLAGPRAQEAFLLRVLMRPPWSIRVQDEAPLTVVAMTGAPGWIRAEDGPIELRQGDVALIRATPDYVMSSRPGLAPTVTIGRDQLCSGDGRDLSADLGGELRSWGNDAAGPDTFLIGTYRTRAETGRLLLAGLPPVTVVHDPAPEVVHLITQEAPHDTPGQSVVLDCLLDLLLIATLRHHHGGGATIGPATQQDPAVAAALRAMLDDVAHPWTVDELARTAGTSRAAFARRFHDALGTPPIAYLTRWRLALAADLLRDTDLPVSSIATRVGYASPFSLSAAFKQRYGVSPAQYRDRVAVGDS